MRPIIRRIGQWAVRAGHAIRQGLAVITPLRLAEDAVLLLIALQLTVVGFNGLNNSKPVLGLKLENQLVGQLAGGDFKQQTEDIIYQYENTNIPIKVAGQDSVITLRQLGVDINPKQVQAELLTEGRKNNPVARTIDQDLAAVGARNISLDKSNFNNELAKAYIATLDQKITVPPANAYFAYKDQKVIVHADTAGSAVDVEAALQALRSAQPGQKDPVALPTKEVPATVTASLLKPLLQQAQSIAQKPLTVAAGDSRTTLSPEQLVALIVPKVMPDPKDAKKMTAQITFDEAKLNAIVDGVVGKAVVAPQPTIMSGGEVIKQGKSGIQTEDSHSLARILTALVQRQTGAAAPDEAKIPLVTVSPPVVHQVARSTNSPRTRTGTGQIRLTFDDGPGAYTEQVLDILKRYNVRATFYVIGRNVQSYPGTMQRIVREGHKVGNHSFSHANLAYLSREGVVRELSSTQAAIREACGVTPTAFRPPYGSHNATVRDVAADMGMSVDMWSIDTRDWARPGSGVITQRVLSNTHSGGVVLMHVLGQQSVSALPSIIEGVRAQGYTLE